MPPSAPGTAKWIAIGRIRISGQKRSTWRPRTQSPTSSSATPMITVVREIVATAPIAQIAAATIQSRARSTELARPTR